MVSHDRLRVTTRLWIAFRRLFGSVVWFFLDSASYGFNNLISSLPPQACKEKADAVLFLFSFTDRSSFEDVPALISRTLSQEEGAARVVIGTKYPIQGIFQNVPLFLKMG